jgi:hypothetical protein
MFMNFSGRGSFFFYLSTTTFKDFFPIKSDVLLIVQFLISLEDPDEGDADNKEHVDSKYFNMFLFAVPS